MAMGSPSTPCRGDLGADHARRCQLTTPPKAYERRRALPGPCLGEAEAAEAARAAEAAALASSAAAEVRALWARLDACRTALLAANNRVCVDDRVLCGALLLYQAAWRADAAPDAADLPAALWAALKMQGHREGLPGASLLAAACSCTHAALHACEARLYAACNWRMAAILRAADII